MSFVAKIFGPDSVVKFSIVIIIIQTLFHENNKTKHFESFRNASGVRKSQLLDFWKYQNKFYIFTIN